MLLFFNEFPDDEVSIAIEFSPEKKYNEVIEHIKKFAGFNLILDIQ